MPLTPAEKSLRGQIAAHESWSRTSDRSARTANARKAMLDRFEQEVDPDGKLPPAERAKRAEHKRQAYFKRLALKSATARRRRGGAPPGDSPRPASGVSTSPSKSESIEAARIAQLDGGDHAA
jgi:hypothetical protein